MAEDTENIFMEGEEIVTNHGERNILGGTKEGKQRLRKLYLVKITFCVKLIEVILKRKCEKECWGHRNK